MRRLDESDFSKSRDEITHRPTGSYFTLLQLVPSRPSHRESLSWGFNPSNLSVRMENVRKTDGNPFNGDLEFWMTHLPPFLKRLPIIHLAIPGEFCPSTWWHLLLVCTQTKRPSVAILPQAPSTIDTIGNIPMSILFRLFYSIFIYIIASARFRNSVESTDTVIALSYRHRICAIDWNIGIIGEFQSGRLLCRSI